MIPGAADSYTARVEVERGCQLRLCSCQTGRVDGAQRSQQTVAIYQVYEDILSGVYSSGGNTAALERVALHAAQESARNLSSNHSAH
jgi:hypothetical protein